MLLPVAVRYALLQAVVVGGQVGASVPGHHLLTRLALRNRRRAQLLRSLGWERDMGANVCEHENLVAPAGVSRGHPRVPCRLDLTIDGSYVCA